MFDYASLARRLLQKKVFHKIPVVALVAIVLAGFAAAAVLVGPPGQNQNQNIAEAIPQISGLEVNPLYGDILGGKQFWFNVTVGTNTYKIAENMRPLISATNLTAGTDVVLIASLDGISYSFTNPTVTQSGSVFTYDFGTSFQQSVAAGATGASAPKWYFQFHYAVSTLPASVVTWSAQFATG
ncbi:MAG TPA: hypothetical protein VF992_06135 [Thermoplasmata archaeon]